jgi:hypothetical protein
MCELKARSLAFCDYVVDSLKHLMVWLGDLSLGERGLNRVLVGCAYGRGR